MDESFLQVLNHLTLRQFLWGACSIVVLTAIWIAITAFAWRRAIRWARR